MVEIRFWNRAQIQDQGWAFRMMGRVYPTLHPSCCKTRQSFDDFLAIFKKKIPNLPANFDRRYLDAWSRYDFGTGLMATTKDGGFEEWVGLTPWCSPFSCKLGGHDFCDFQNKKKFHKIFFQKSRGSLLLFCIWRPETKFGPI